MLKRRIERIITTAYCSFFSYPSDAENWKDMPLVIRVSLRANYHRSEDCMWSQCQTKTIARWMTEVNALQSLAMSTSAFKLLFDGDPYPELVQHVFNALFKKKRLASRFGY
jgi:hypothetical protein